MSYDLTAKIYQDADAARELLEALRWPNGAVCSHCGCLGATKLEGAKHRAGVYQCNECREQFTVIGRYCAEFDFRYNTRKENDVVRRDIALKGIEGKRLTYRRAGQAEHA